MPNGYGLPDAHRTRCVNRSVLTVCTGDTTLNPHRLFTAESLLATAASSSNSLPHMSLLAPFTGLKPAPSAHSANAPTIVHSTAPPAVVAMRTPITTAAAGIATTPATSTVPISTYITPPNAAPTVPVNAVSARPRKPPAVRSRLPPRAPHASGAAPPPAVATPTQSLSFASPAPATAAHITSPPLGAMTAPLIPPSPITSLSSSLVNTTLNSPAPQSTPSVPTTVSTGAAAPVHGGGVPRKEKHKRLSFGTSTTDKVWRCFFTAARLNRSLVVVHRERRRSVESVMNTNRRIRQQTIQTMTTTRQPLIPTTRH